MPRHNERIHFKVLKDGSPIRRLSFDEQPTWETLITTLRKLYEIPPHLDLSLSYIDSDHDKITANSNDELRALYDYCDSKAGYRVILSTFPAASLSAGVASNSTNEECSDEEGSVHTEGTQRKTTGSASYVDTPPPPLTPTSSDSGHGHPMSPPPGYAPANPHVQHPFGFPQHAYGLNSYQGMLGNPGTTPPTMDYPGPGGLYPVPMTMSYPTSTWKDGNATVAVSPLTGPLHPHHPWAALGFPPSQGLAMEKSVNGHDLLVFSGGAVYPPSHHYSAVNCSVDSGAMHVD